jgi:protein-disulfide isomerase
MLEARRLGVRATPTFLINGRRLVGAHPIESFREVIEEALRGRSGKR